MRRGCISVPNTNVMLYPCQTKPFDRWLTEEVLAVVEVHVLHSFGEHDLANGTCSIVEEVRRRK